MVLSLAAFVLCLILILGDTKFWADIVFHDTGVNDVETVKAKGFMNIRAQDSVNWKIRRWQALAGT